MKVLVAVFGFVALVKTGLGEEPRSVAQADLTAIVAAVTRGEPVRITSGASGFNLYGQGKSGHIGASAGGLVVQYGGESYRAAKVAGGWAISGKDFHARVASRSGGGSISGNVTGSVSQVAGNSTQVNVDGKTLRTSPSAGGAVNLH